jgi:two-component system sensor histidine kinase UhpB
LIAQQTADAMIIHDLNGNISFWNPAAQRIFGYTSKEMIGKSASLLSPRELAEDLAQNLEVITSGQSIDNHITRRISKSGQIIDVSISAAPLIDPKTNVVIGDICSMRDITELKKAQETERKLEENRQLTHVIQKHIEDERRSLARELHDELGQYVTAIKTFAVAIANKTQASANNAGMPDVEGHARVIVSAANQIYDGMHNIIRQLRPGSLDNLGLAETLKDVVSSYQMQNPNIKINLQLKGDLHGLGETVSINLYRIVQESINNALKYAEATTIDVKLTKFKTDNLQLDIVDNGKGMDVESVDQTSHFGILGMRERAQALHGSFKIVSVKDKGTAIHVKIPNTFTT